METNMNGIEVQNSCGIKKIVDCKISDDGRQMYQVKWEPTWEPAENLVNCQHLIDDFWSHVNKVKYFEECVLQSRKKWKLDTGPDKNDNDSLEQYRLTPGSRANIQRLIARTDASTTGSTILTSPSNILSNLQANMSNGVKTENTNRKLKSYNSLLEAHQLVKSENSPVKTGLEISSSPSSKTGNSSLKYLENFDNPYVKVIVVCKMCNKEQSFKVVSNWKRHYLTHSEEKPHKCPHCPKAFVQSDKLRNHVLSKHGNESQFISLDEGHVLIKNNDFM